MVARGSFATRKRLKGILQQDKLEEFLEQFPREGGAERELHGVEGDFQNWLGLAM